MTGEEIMIVVMKEGVTPAQVVNAMARIEQLGGRVQVSEDGGRTTLGVIDNGRALDAEQIAALDGVDSIRPVTQPFKLASRDFCPQDTVVPINGVSVGGEQVVVMAGPCAVENREQILGVAQAVHRAGAQVLRGGAFKPRTSPYSFQGLGEEGLHLLAEARAQTGMPIVTEVITPEQVPLVTAYADVLQIGARNMQNFSLLHAAGKSQRPVLLKRGMMSTITEFLMSAEYILSHGNDRVILCERGIRTFERLTRNTLDITAVPLLKKLSHLPVLVDPSHATGNWELVTAVSRAAIAAGADGLIVEVHPNPAQAVSDGAQSLKPQVFGQLMRDVRVIAQAMGRTL